MKKFRFIVTVILILVMCLSVAGCGGSTSNGSSSSSAPSQTPAPLTATNPSAPAEAGKMVSGGVLNVLVANLPAAFGNLKEKSWSIDVSRYCLPAVEPLVGMSKEGPVPTMLATGWDIAQDGKSITFKLREGVKFHDGTDFNAKAVKWNIEKIISQKKELGIITSIDVIDEHTVKFNLSSFSNTLLYHLSYYDGMMISPESYEGRDAEYIATHMVGTGPFVFDTFQADTKIIFKKFDGYWDAGKPYLDGWEFVMSTDASTSKNALLTGQVQAWDNVSPANAKQLKEQGYGVNFCPGLVRIAHPDSTNPDSPFSKKEVRYAFEYAIDKTAIADTYGEGTWEVPSGLSASNQIGVNSITEARKYDPVKAKELLAQAGYQNGFDMVIIAPKGVSADILGAVQGYLRAVGINAELKHLDNASVNAFRTGGWNNGVLIQGMSASSVSNAVSFEADGPSKSKAFSTLVTPEYSAFLKQLVSANTMDEEKRLTGELLKLTNEEANIIPIVTESRITVFSSKVHDFDVNSYSQWVINPANTWMEK